MNLKNLNIVKDSDSGKIDFDQFKDAVEVCINEAVALWEGPKESRDTVYRGVPIEFSIEEDDEGNVINKIVIGNNTTVLGPDGEVDYRSLYKVFLREVGPDSWQ